MLQDWTKTIFQYDLNQSLWFAANNTCYFPNDIKFDVLYSTAGSPDNLQFYIVSTRIKADYKYKQFAKVNVNEAETIIMNLIINFIPITANALTQAKKNPSVLPKLPMDVVNPFSNI